MQGLRQETAVAVMEPGGEPLGGGEEVDIAGDEAGIDVIIGFLHFGVLQPRFLEAGGVDEAVDVGDVDQLHRRVGGALAGIHGAGAVVADDHGGEVVVEGIVEVDAVLQGDVEVDLLRIARRGGGAADAVEGAGEAVDAEGGPEQVGQHLPGQRGGRDGADGLALFQRGEHRTVAAGRGQRQSEGGARFGHDGASCSLAGGPRRGTVAAGRGGWIDLSQLQPS